MEEKELVLVYSGNQAFIGFKGAEDSKGMLTLENALKVNEVNVPLPNGQGIGRIQSLSPLFGNQKELSDILIRPEVIVKIKFNSDMFKHYEEIKAEMSGIVIPSLTLH